jgi:hopanoid biosynthesis associated protein HpnK
MGTRRLIVNADDFGFTNDVNAGILEAHQHGILTAATLMANGPAFEQAVELARAHRTLDVGCHLVLIGGRPVSRPQQEFPRNVKELMLRLMDRAFRQWIYTELEAQVQRILRAGISPTHLDTHKHTHLAPPVLDALCRVSQRFGIRWVRRPFDLPLSGNASFSTRAVNTSLRRLRSRFDRKLKAHGCITTDHFAGFQLTGAFRAGELAALIRALPEGLTEFMCHPGRCTSELRGAPTRLKESRERELQALMSAEVRQVLEREGIELTNYSKAGQPG